MLKRPSVAIAIAVVLALLAGLAVFWYASSAENRAVQGEQAVTVYVSTQTIPEGTPLGSLVDQGLAKQTQVSAKLTPQGAVSVIDGTNASLVAVDQIPQDQVLLAGDFTSGLTKSTAIAIPDGMMAMSMVLGSPQKIDFVRPGSRIAIFDTVSTVNVDVPDAPAILTTRPLLDGIEVLAIGTTTEQGAPAAAPETWSNSLVTVSVDQTQAEKLIHAIQSGGQLWMTLLGENTTLKPSVGVGNDDLFK